MNDDKATDEIKNLYVDFKILATKVNDDNKNSKKKLEETTKIVEVCKREYQKLFYEHNTLKKNIASWNKNWKFKNQYQENKKRKYYVVNQNNYESDRESDASTNKNEIETSTGDNDDDDDDYGKTIKKKKIIKKVKQVTNNQRKRKQLGKKKQTNWNRSE